MKDFVGYQSIVKNGFSLDEARLFLEHTFANNLSEPVSQSLG